MSTADLLRKRQAASPGGEAGGQRLWEGGDIPEELISGHADPVIRRVLLRRLRLFLSPSQSSLAMPESEDLYQTILLKLVNSLAREGKDGIVPGTIDEFRGYVAAIAHNVCNDALRGKYPVRHRLKTNIRDLLRRDGRLRSWKFDDQTLCGYGGWAGRGESSKAALLLEDPEGESSQRVLAGFRRRFAESGRLSELVLGILEWSGGPVELENLVWIVAAVQGVKDQPAESLDEVALPGGRGAGAGVADMLEAKEMLRRIWDSARLLPSDQRLVFNLTSSDHFGESLLHRLLRDRVVGLGELCSGLDLSREELLGIWGQLPMGTPAIAAFLGTTPAMIAKWRHRAATRIRRSLGGRS